VKGLLPLVWKRQWHSKSTHFGDLGYGWSHSFEMAIMDTQPSSVCVRLADGRIVFFNRPQHGVPSLNLSEKLLLHLEGEDYRISDYSGHSYYFGSPVDSKGKKRFLTKIATHMGEEILLQRDHEGVLIGMMDCQQRQFNVHRDHADRITSITGPSAKGEPDTQTFVSYRYDDEGNMSSASDPVKATEEFTYENHLIVSHTELNGVCYQFTWDDPL